MRFFEAFLKTFCGEEIPDDDLKIVDVRHLVPLKGQDVPPRNIKIPHTSCDPKKKKRYRRRLSASVAFFLRIRFQGRLLAFVDRFYWWNIFISTIKKPFCIAARVS